MKHHESNLDAMLKSMDLVELGAEHLARVVGGYSLQPVFNSSGGWTDCAVGADGKVRCCKFDAEGHSQGCW